MISSALEAQIRRLHYAEGWPVGTIAAQLSVHHSVVSRVLAADGAPRTKAFRPRMIEPYLAFVLETLRRFPKLTASRLYEMVRQRGYTGGPDHFRHQLANVRPRPPAEAFLRLRTLAGEEAQVDWAHFGRLEIGRAKRQLLAFVMVLSYSRMVFCRFFLGAKMESFLRGHEAAFSFFGGVPRRLLYDNLKSAVLERVGDAVRFHPTLLEYAGHYRFEPRPVAPYRGNEKGRVERAIRYLRGSFYEARTWKNLDDLNAQVAAWCLASAADRPWPEDKGLAVRDAFQVERPRLLGLPEFPFPTLERVEVKIGKTPYARFDLNDYSVPHTKTRQTLVVVADPARVRVLDGDAVLADHLRSYGKGEQIEEAAHIEALWATKRNARSGSGTQRLLAKVPDAQALLDELAQRGENLGAAVSALLRYLKLYPPVWVAEATREALARGTPRANSVRFLLEKRQRAEGRVAPLSLELSDDPRVRDLDVRPHDLATYDTLKEVPLEDDEPDPST